MSSVVNKSSKRFAPKAPGVRGGRKPRKHSTTQPPPTPELAPKEKELVKEAQETSAIIDEEEEAPLPTPELTQQQSQPDKTRTLSQSKPKPDDESETKETENESASKPDGTTEEPADKSPASIPAPTIQRPSVAASPVNRLNSLKRRPFQPLRRPTTAPLVRPNQRTATPATPGTPATPATPAGVSSPSSDSRGPVESATPNSSEQQTNNRQATAASLPTERSKSPSPDKPGDKTGKEAQISSRQKALEKRRGKQKAVAAATAVAFSVSVEGQPSDNNNGTGRRTRSSANNTNENNEDGSAQVQVVKEPRFDEQGRMIIDPDDLPKYGRGHRSRPLADADMKIINAETFTMAHLCKDLPIGVANEDYEKYEQARIKRKEARAKFLAAKRRAKLAGLPIPQFADEDEEARRLEEERKRKEFQDEFKNSTFVDTTQKIQPKLTFKDGLMVVDQDSTQIDRQKIAQDRNESQYERVGDDDDERYSKMTNSASFANRERPERWDGYETIQFYKALSQWGTDFNVISQLFPGRSRRQIKSKFKHEERKNPHKVHLALLRKLPVDLDEFSVVANHDLKSVETIEQELERIRVKHEEDMKVQEEALKKAKEEDAAAAQKRENEQFGGSRPSKRQKSIKSETIEDNAVVKVDDDGSSEQIIGYVGDRR